MKHDNETMWQALLQIIRAVVLGRRLPPDQLRMFLLFAEPVPYLSAEQIAEMLGEGCGDELRPPLPEGWSQGFSINDPESGDCYDADRQIMGEMLIDLLRNEHPEWENQCWHVTTCDQGYSYISYQVLDSRQRVVPIACWMEGKLTQLRKRELEPNEAHRKTVICRFIESSLEWLTENVGDERELAQLEEDDQIAGERIHAYFSTRETSRLDPDYKEFYGILSRCAEHIYDSGQWALEEWSSPFEYTIPFWEALSALRYVDVDVTGHAPAKQQRGLFAA